MSFLVGACGLKTHSASETCARNPDHPKCAVLYPRPPTGGTNGTGGVGASSGTSSPGTVSPNPAEPSPTCPNTSADCDRDPINGCEIDIATDVMHCGACGSKCPGSHVAISCVAGQCVYAACDAGWGDCDGRKDNGCETNIRRLTDCGDCNVLCADPNAIKLTCARGVCESSSCQEGYEECDGDPNTLCETSLRTLKNCGACGTACKAEHTLDAQCNSGICNWTQCEAGWEDCDSDRLNGCEVELNTDANNCGTCGTTCSQAQVCKAGTCTTLCSALAEAGPRIAVGWFHTCALLSSSEISCWGSNAFGKLGVGSFDENATRPGGRVQVSLDQALGSVNQITVGAHSTCALLASGEVTCWGENSYGQLGIGTSGFMAHVARAQQAVQVSSARNLTGATQIAAGSSHTCALLASGEVTCWGENSYGQLGIGTSGSMAGTSGSMAGTTRAKKHVQVSAAQNLTGATQITAGGGRACALLVSGEVTCWGENSYGQLGIGTHENTTDTTRAGNHVQVSAVQTLTGATQIATGYIHTCALLGSGEVTCWGANLDGQLGIGTSGSGKHRARADQLVQDSSGGTLQGVIQIATGTSHTCALLASGNLKCWGGNDKGQLGISSTSAHIPRATKSVLIPPDHRESFVVQVAAGRAHTCVLLSSGAVLCWGDNASGQLGVGTTIDTNRPTVAVSPLSTEPCATTAQP